MRLNKYLALCGLGSRRAVEQIILEGQVTINGRKVADLATQVDEGHDVVSVGESILQPVHSRNYEYILLNKPHGYDVTRGGRHHHRRAWDLLPKETHPSVQSVGRLDRDSTGLLIFTNDGDLAYRLTHPRYGCRKVYEVETEREMNDETLRRLKTGVDLEDGPAHAVSAERIPADVSGYPRVQIVMEEGRNRIVRRMCDAVGHPAVNLNRSAIGPLQLGSLARGKTRLLNRREITKLRKLVGLTGAATEEAAAKPAPRPGRGAPRTPAHAARRPESQGPKPPAGRGKRVYGTPRPERGKPYPPPRKRRAE